MNEIAVMLEALELEQEIEEVSRVLREIEERMNGVLKEGYLELERDIASLLID